MRSLLPLLCFFATGFPSLGAGDAPLPTLTAVRDLRNLSATEAERHYPVHLRAVVTLVEPERTIFLRDETGASFIRWSRELPELHTGQQIEVEGESYPGLYLTGISGRKVTVLGEGGPPTPRPVNYEQLASGQYHYEWVEVRGIVRAVTPGEKYSVLKLALGNGSLDVYPVTDESFAGEHLIDATVRVVGIAAGYINDRRQLVAPHLRVRSLADIDVLEAALEEPFSIDATPAAELLRFAPNGRAGHRVKVRGVVTHQEPGDAIYLRDTLQGLRIRSATNERFSPGEIVETLGFPSMGILSAELEDAILRRTGESAIAAASTVTVKDLANGKFDANLVSLVAEVRDVVHESDRLRLTLQAEGTVFQAVARSALAEVPPAGARVRLTGICRVIEATQPTRSFSTRARAFELILRPIASDIEILRHPPWWTARRLAIAAASLLGLALLAVVWAASLRRQVRRQTALIRHQVEAVAIADERQRIAREFHDTLEQELVGVTLRLEAAESRAGEAKLRELIAGAQRLVRQLQTGARSFVWNLRESGLSALPLAEAIRAAAAKATAGRRFEMRALGGARRLPEGIGHELLRVAQEASANAVKHGNARSITVTLDFTVAPRVQLVIEDDGAGFDPSAPVPAGHFGLLGIRERVQKLGGEFRLRSQPGGGTTVEVIVPIPAAME